MNRPLLATALLALLLWPARALADAPTTHLVTSPQEVQGSVAGRLVDAGVTDPAFLDNPATNLFMLTGAHGPIHHLSYAAAGVIGGYAQEGYNEYAQPVGPGYAQVWLGTYYASGVGAASVLADVTATLRSEGYATRSCGQAPAACVAFTIPWTDSAGKPHTLLYGIEQQSNAVGEIGLDGFAGEIATQGKVVELSFDTAALSLHTSLSAAASAAAQPAVATTPSPPLQGIHPVLAGGGEWGIAVANHGQIRFPETVTNKIRVGQAAAFWTSFYAIDFQLSDVSAILTISRGGQTVRTIPMARTSGGLFEYFTATGVKFTKPQLVGPLTATFTVKGGSVSLSLTYPFQLLPAPKCRKGQHPVNGKCK